MKRFRFLWLAVVAIATVSCNLEPSIDYLRLCNNPDYDITCPEDMAVFKASETDTIFLTATLNHVVEGTGISIVWYYLGHGEQEIGRVDSKMEEDATDYPVNTKLWPPSEGWPIGEYKVIIDLDAENFNPMEKTFSVE